MKKLILIVLATISSSASMMAARQDNAVEGRVIDKSTGEPLEWVTIAVRDNDSTVVACATTDNNGSFRLSAQNGHKLTASLIGYKEAVVRLTSEMRVSPLVIELEQDRESLAAATVTEKVRLVEVKMDKVVMNVSQSAFAQGSNGLELIKKAPGVVIDKDGNITLNGKAVSIWLDGRPSYLDGKSLEALLRSTDGGTIEKFEIM
ncbi:MAG: carboxypeptidase-like regulatory domain-containing protein, partial [Candidatus Cryptobacteroides sp.]